MMFWLLRRWRVTARQAATPPIGARLETLDLSAMRQEWRRLYRAEPPRLSRDLMMRAIAYRIQEIAFGGLSKATLRRLATLATEFESDGRIATPAKPRIKPGARLVREWHGRTHAVVVTEDGFEFEGKLHRSLTSIARKITGAGWSGPRFFGLAKAADASGGTDVPLGKSVLDGRRAGDPSQCMEASRKPRQEGSSSSDPEAEASGKARGLSRAL